MSRALTFVMSESLPVRTAAADILSILRKLEPQERTVVLCALLREFSERLHHGESV
jgi:hypothetical protein